MTVADPQGLANAETFPALLIANARERGQRPASREKEFGIWQSWTWQEVHDEARALALGLVALGMQPGDRMAIIGSNRPRLYWSIVACQMAGGVPVPVYQDAVAEEMAFILDHCEARFALAEDQEQVDKVLSIQERLPTITHILYEDPRGLRNYDHSTLHDYAEVQKLGRAAEAEQGPAMDARIARMQGSDTCVMLYTSGTTGKPKGVVLSHDNILITARAAAEFDGLTEQDSMLAYLPLAWVGDFIFSMGQAYVCGFCVACPESADTMHADLRELGPTYFFAPPRIFESLLTMVTIRMEDAGAIKRWLFARFMAHAKAMEAKRRAGSPLTGWENFLTRLGEILVYGPLKNVLGMTRVRVAYTAGEAIGPDLFAFYRSIGVPMKQLYGQTEASVFITQHPDDAVDPETVGVPTPGVEIQIREGGEVFYRSPGVFVEYYKNPAGTRETKDEEGWVATGDAGFFDERTGQLRILDRAKDVGKLADGKLFAPKYLENKLKFFPNILEAVVFGHERDRCMAMVNIDLSAVGNWAERNNIAYGSYQELSQHPRVLEMIEEHVRDTNRSLAEDPMLSHCQIARFLVLHKELDADDGELTRTRKVRRRFISEKFEDLVTALYSDMGEITTETEVTYEDGRKGAIRATLKIRDAETFPPAHARPTADRAA
ncbi:long-chain fatty acid--CoA ligase [Paralimibaculum aggregatum]|uniref:Long-chain fatty acid--CoA ligase n=1 Tax=Paralimibaculum aggregatum TaxID=3036245 RepID=A0ABQ6LFD6_9RHOB|nr:AMP-binding protein [Limibaculum sp. NKW23]GMG80945.1 long-chain fatty acid--CoA ligase [Limibaculum sp. NKW23]